METFWLQDPKVLIEYDNLCKLWPIIGDNISTKLNAITRVIVLLSIIGFVFLKNDPLRLFVTMVVTLLVIIIYHNYRMKQENMQGTMNKLKRPNDTNPLMNPLIGNTGDKDNNNASKSYDLDIKNEILEKNKLNRNDKSYSNTMENEANDRNYDRSFHTVANTQLPNDQHAFSEFCYGNTAFNKDADFKV